MDCNLLLVDDEPHIAQALQRALHKEGYQIFVANDGDTALKLMGEHPIDVIVSDHQMQGMTGAQLLSTVRQSYPDTVRIMLSGPADLEAVMQAVNEGSIDKFLTKPWSNDTLRAILKEAAVVAKSSRQVAKPTLATAYAQQLQGVAGPARLVMFEVRNASVNSLLSAQQKQELLVELGTRCVAVAGELLVPVAAIENSVLAGVIPVHEGLDMQALAMAASQPYVLQGQIAPLRLALGYADSKTPATDDDWLRRGLIALTATNFAGEVTAFSEGIKADLHERHSIERDMMEGLNNKEFFIQLQPQVCGKTFTIKGAETLCRWLHPQRGLIAPLQFIDLAERNGFIHDLGAWVIRESCRVAGLLAQRNAQSIKISFNVSPRQFTTPGWTQLVADYARAEGVDPRRLQVEITESTVMDNPDQALRIMNELKEIGVQLAMDDFGTGQSSLGMLKTLPIDVLKFDRSLVQGIETDDRSRTMFYRLVEMAHELGLESIAEGVETEGQAQLCQEIGCGLIQGYAFHRPVAVGEFFQLIEGGLGGRH